MKGIVSLKRRRKEEFRDPQPRGEPDFGQMYADHVRGVYAYIAWRIGQQQTAEDLTSLVFERAWASLATFDSSRGSASTWLFTIARNAVTDHFRRAARSREIPLDEWISAESGQSDPENQFLTRERRLRLGGVIAELDEREREILSLKFGAGLTNREIAQLLDISESNAGTIIYRSLEKIKTRLEGVMEND